MSLSVDYCYQFALKLIRKNQAGPFSSIDFQYQWNDASSSYQDDLLGRFQARNNGKSGNNTGLIENETILTKLTPFTKPVTLTVISGNAKKPTDFVYTLALRIGNEAIYSINKDQIYWVKQNVIDPPSIIDNSYYYTEYQDYYSIFPNTVANIDLDYIATPVNIVWGFTFDLQGRQVYNVGTSTQPEWDSNSCREITKRMLKSLGVSFKDADFQGFGQSVIQSGE